MTTRNVHPVVVLGVLAVVGLALLGLSAVRDQAGRNAPSAARPGLDLLPAAADFALLLDSGASIRQSGAGDVLLSLLDTDGTVADARRAWPETAQRLGWTPDELFERLLGKRVLLAAEGESTPRASDDAAERGWVMICEIDRDTDKRLRERLTAAPRALQSGHQVLSLEAGRYELAISRLGAPAKGKTADEPLLLVVGPTGRPALFESVLAILGRRRNLAGTSASAVTLLSQTDAGARADGAAESDVRLLVRLSGDASAPPWSDFALISGQAAADGREWTLRLTMRDRARRPQFSRVREMSDAPFRQMIRTGAAAAVLQNSTVAPLPHQKVPAEAEGVLPVDIPARAAGALGALLLDLGLDAETQGRLTGRQALIIRTVDVPPDASARPILPAFTFAFETTDPRGLARLLDRRVAVMANTLERRLGGGTTPPRDFVGVRPEAVRVLPLESPASNPLSVLIGQGPGPGGPTVCWSYPSDERAEGSGWWVVTGVPGVPGRAELPVDPAASHRVAAAAISPSKEPVEGESMKRWMSLGHLERKPLEPALPLLLPENATIRRAVSRIDVLQWRTWLAGEADLSGEFTLTLSPKAPPQPSVKTP